MNILAVGAHPDDVETMCAGTLAKYAAQGHKVFIATATNGNIGSAHHTMEQIGRIRKQEAANSAAIIGAEYICLDYDDEMFFEIDRETRLKFINLVRHCKADVIFTHNPHDYNPDHMLTSKIINDIAVMIPIAHLKTEEPPYNVIPSIWYFEPANSMGFVPTDYVDITDYFDTKMKMLSCMESQKQWMADNYAQLGGFRCPSCGHRREEPAVCVEKIDELGLDSSTVELSVDGKTEKVYVNQPTIYNIYNAAGAVAAATAMGIPAEDAERAVGSFDCGFGRMEKFALGAAGARMVLVKNAAGTNQVIEFLARQSAPFDLVFVTNNRVSDGTDISWLADAEFETLAALPALGAVTVSGTCAEQMTARLHAAGVAEDKLHLQPDLAAVAETVSAAERPVFILPSYTGMMELRPLLLRRCGGKEFWE